MGDLPTFSLIIPTRNRARLLKRCLQSISEQAYTNWEAIVVDDGSTDETQDITSSFSDPRIKYIHQTHSERGAARNRGVQAAVAPFVCFVDDDDYILPHHLLQFHQAIQSYGPRNIYRCQYVKKSSYASSLGPVYELSKHRNPVSFSAFEFCGLWSLCIPKHFLIKELSPVQFPQWEDTHLILRLLSHTGLCQLSETTYVYSQHEQMGSQKIFTVDNTSQKVELNVKAIRHFFKNYNQIAERYLPPNTEKLLVAQKYLQHAHEACKHRQKDIARRFFKKSLKEGCFPYAFGVSYIKFYVKIILNWCESLK